MLRRGVLRAGAAIGLTGVAECSGRSDDSNFTEGCGDDIGDWEPDETINPGVDIEDFGREVEVSAVEAAERDRSLRAWNEGDYDGGLTKATHPISAEAGRAHQVKAARQFWSEPESSDAIRHAVMRLVPEPATVEEDVPQLGVDSTDSGETPYGGLREPLLRGTTGVHVRVDDAGAVD